MRRRETRHAPGSTGRTTNRVEDVPRRLFRIAATLLAVAAATSVHAATLQVTHTGSSGSGSLADAIAEANDIAGADTIIFEIPGVGTRKIKGVLPPITDTLTIDGYTQAGSSPNTVPAGATNAVLLIELDASGIEPGKPLLDIRATGTVIRGLAITKVPQDFIVHWDRSAAIEIASDAIDVVVEGCFIGTNAAGSIGTSGGDGIVIHGRARIGGGEPSQRNLISGNQAGVEILRKSSVVQGNLLGTDADGEPILGNLTAVLLSEDRANGNLIGGTEPHQGNLIAGNDCAIRVASTSSGNTFLGNSIHSNNTAIDLGIDGSTPNDELDRDEGPNRLQNYFEISHARRHGSTLRVEGYIRSHPGSYVVELFHNEDAGFQNDGGGQTLFARFTLEIPHGKTSAFYADDVELELPAHPVYITATATREATGDTSEFSPSVIAIEGGEILTVTNTLDSGPGSLRAAVATANSSENVNTIAFEIPGDGPRVIELADGLHLTKRTILDGYTQPGAHPNSLHRGSNARPLIVLDGNASEATMAITLSGPAKLVRGLTIGRFAGSAVFVNTPMTGTVIEGNFLGTDHTGSVRRRNDGFGVHVGPEAFEVTIGGDSAHQRNIISGNGKSGIMNEAFSTMIWGNLVGGSADGPALGNDMHGIEVSFGRATIGAVFRFGAANQIRGNGLAGVRVSGGLDTSIRGNDIFDNGGLGIDLGTEGVTPNDIDDLDDGPNYLKNAPVLTSARLAAGKITIAGFLNVGFERADQWIEFFASDSCDESGYGEGREYISARTLQVSGNTELFELTLPAEVAAGKAITATAADFGTSEFSNCIVAAPVCGDVDRNGQVTTSDALGVLRAASGIQPCLPCICDANESGSLTAMDALMTLRSAVSQDSLTCPACN